MKRSCFLLFFLILLFIMTLNACSSKHSGVQEGNESIFYTLSDTYDTKDYAYNNEESFAVNSYLSIFTRTGFMRNSSFSLSTASDIELLKLIRLIITIQSQEPIKTINIKNEEYYKISESTLNKYLKKYFNAKILPQDEDYIFYDEGYYYWSKPEALSHINASFALIDEIESLGNDYYSVNFSLFNTRSDYTDTFKEKHLKYSKPEAILQFPRGRIDNLNAVINANDLSDLNSMQLVYMQKNSSSEK